MHNLTTHPQIYDNEGNNFMKIMHCQRKIYYYTFAYMQ